MLLAPAPRLSFFLAWLPSGAVSSPRLSVKASRGAEGVGGKGARGISPSCCLSLVRALCAVCSEQAKSAEKNRDDAASGVYGLPGEQDG